MIQPLVLTLINKINLSYLIFFWNSWWNDKKLKILLWPSPHPLPFVPVSINYFTFKENLSELQPYLGNGYLVSRNAGNNVSECPFKKISWGTMPPDPPRKLALWALERRQKYVTSGASTNMSATLQNYWNPWYPIVSQTLEQRKPLSSPLNKPKIARGEGAESDWISGDGVQWLFYYVKSYRSVRKYSFSSW